MRSAIVGCGNIARLHADAIRNLPGTELVAVADCKKEATARLVNEFEGLTCTTYTSLEEMLEKETIDVLHVCTPHYLHVPMTIYALERNINVFMEKPPAISSKQFKSLQSVQTNAKLGICFQNRYNKSVEAIKALLDSGQAGKILGARAFVTWQRGETYYTGSDWRGKLATEGGGALINQAIHTLDLLGYFMGKATSVEATTSNHHLKGVIEVEDTVEAYINFNTIAANFYATTAFCSNSPVFIELVCENRMITMEETEVTYKFPNNTKKVISFKKEQSMGKNYWGDGHIACIKDFYTCLEHNTPFKIDITEVAKVQALLLGIYESAKNKKIIHL